ncbi:hypothetical protein L6R52_32455 [Myxococcota bacterium]|nr:hypothetical protein [Myxococcota bacterium]
MPAPILVVSPRGVAAGLRSSELVRLTSEELQTRTDLRGLSPEQAGIDLERFAACPVRERFRCWLELTRPQEARFVFVYRVEPLGPTRDRVSLLAVDVPRARALAAAVSPIGDGWQDQVEDVIFASAVQVEPRDIDVSAPEQLERAVADAIEALRPELERAGHWEPWGALLVELPCPSCTVVAGERTVAMPKSGPLELPRLRPGPRTLRVFEGAEPRWSCELAVERRQVHTVREGDCTFIELTAAQDPRPRWALGATGVAVGATGAALTLWGAVRASSGPATICILPNGTVSDGTVSDGTGCAGLGTPTFGFDPSATPTIDAGAVNPRGVQIVPLGLALVAAGTTWSLGQVLFDDWPWWAHLAAGTALGAAAYGLGALAGAP